MVTYQQLKDGTWQCEGAVFQYRLELSGMLPNSQEETRYVILTNNNDLTFEQVSQSLLGAISSVSNSIEDSVLVELHGAKDSPPK